MKAATPSTCPRCGARFHCGASDPTPCRCATSRLDHAMLQALRERYSSCLCLSCLLQLQRGPEVGDATRLPASTAIVPVPTSSMFAGSAPSTRHLEVEPAADPALLPDAPVTALRRLPA